MQRTEKWGTGRGARSLGPHDFHPLIPLTGCNMAVDFVSKSRTEGEQRHTLKQCSVRETLETTSVSHSMVTVREEKGKQTLPLGEQMGFLPASFQVLRRRYYLHHQLQTAPSKTWARETACSCTRSSTAPSVRVAWHKCLLHWFWDGSRVPLARGRQ